MISAHRTIRNTLLLILSTYLMGCATPAILGGRSNSIYSQEFNPPAPEISISQTFFEQDLPSIRNEACKKRKLDDQKCARITAEALFAKYEMEYPKADWEEASRACKSDPVNCHFDTWQGAQVYEEHLKASHKKARAKIAQENDRRAQNELAEQRRRQLQIIGTALGGTNRRTNCTSVPNGLGGFRTSCSEY